MSSRPQVEKAIEAIVKVIKAKSPGDRLPSVRWLIHNLQLSQATIVTALADLEAQGLVTGRRGSGFYVATPAATRVCILCDPRIIIRYGVSPYYSLLIGSLFRHCSQAGLQASFHFTRMVTLDAAMHRPETSFDASLRSRIRAGVFQGAITLGLIGDQNDFLDHAGCLTVAHAGWGRLNVGIAMDEMIEDWLGALQQRGCRSACLVGAKPSDCQLFLNACSRYGLAGRTSSVGEESHYLASRYESPTKAGFLEAAAAFQGGEMSDSYIFADDMMAQGFLMALSKAGRIDGGPRVATIGVEGSHSLGGWGDDVSVVPISPSRVAETMVRALGRRMKRADSPAPRAERPLFVCDSEGEKWISRFGSLYEPSTVGIGAGAALT